MTFLIKTLTPEQRALIPVYRDKWKQIALSTEPINPEKAKQAIKAAYSAIVATNVETTICHNPDTAADLNRLTIEVWDNLRTVLAHQIKSQLSKPLLSSLIYDFARELGGELKPFLSNLFQPWIKTWTEKSSNWYGQFCLGPEVWAFEGCLIDFSISVLNCTHDRQILEAFQELTNYCGWIIPSAQGFRVCDRSYQLRVDSQNRPHAEAKPALEFSDGYSLYAHHGIALPES